MQTFDWTQRSPLQSHRIQSWCDEAEFSLERVRPSVLQAPPPPALRLVTKEGHPQPEVWDRLAA